MKLLLSVIIFFVATFIHALAYSQTVEWYAPETEKGRTPDRSRVVITGRTQASAKIQIDGESVTVMSKVTGPSTAKIESREARANFEGYFEIAMELPQGLAQIPIKIVADKAQKTFMVSVDVKIVKNHVDEVQLSNTKVTRSKPPAAARRFRLWAGAGGTFQSLKQTTSGSPNLQFQTIQAPGIVLRGGYWGENFGLDLYYRVAPGKVTAEAPLSIATETYQWNTIEAKGLYQFDRGPGSRIAGLPSQWQLRFGTQSHQVPFLNINASNVITVSDASVTTATLGVGLLLGQEKDWSYEFAIGLQQPISSSAAGEFTINSKLAYEAQIGAAYKFAPDWRIGIFSYTQSLNYTYDFKASGATTSKTGEQDLFYTTFDLRLGYEF